MAQSETDQQRRTDDVEGEAQGRQGTSDIEREGSEDQGTDQPESESDEDCAVSEADRLDQANISGGGGRSHGPESGDTGYEQPPWSPGGDVDSGIRKDAANPNVGPLDG